MSYNTRYKQPELSAPAATPAPCSRFLMLGTRARFPGKLLAGKRTLAKLAAWLLLVVSPAALLADPLLTYPLRVGEHQVRAEVANTPETRRKGLMFRTRLAPSSGMIFVFPREQRISMWMKNTPLPLSVAFIAADGRIVNIEKMQPNSQQTHSSRGPAQYALEMNQDWFETRGIKAGDRVSGLHRLPLPK